jgi:hypothetical protein
VTWIVAVPLVLFAEALYTWFLLRRRWFLLAPPSR